MEKHIEKEYKLLVDKADFDILLSFYPNLQFKSQTNFYYDTANFDIMHQQSAMRIRKKEDSFIFTLKKFVNNDLLEYECFVPSLGEQIFDLPEIQSVLKKYGINGPFQLIASMETNRAVYSSDDYELCFDINKYHDSIDYEIEYEYLRDHDGLKNFIQIIKKADLHYTTNCKSKIERALKKQLK